MSAAKEALYDEGAAAQLLIALFRPADEVPSVEAMAGAMLVAVTMRRIRMLTEE